MFPFAAVLTMRMLGQQAAAPKADVVLVVERAAAQGYVYTCNGHRLDPARIATGIDPFLRKTEPASTSLFVLFGEGVPLDNLFEIAALFEGKVA